MMEEVLEVDASECFELNFDENMELVSTVSETLELDYIDKLPHKSEFLKQTDQSFAPRHSLSEPGKADVQEISASNNSTSNNSTEDDVRSRLCNIADKIKVLTKQLADITQKKLKFLDLIKKLSNEIRRLKFKIKEEVKKTKRLNKVLTENVIENVRASAYKPEKPVPSLCKELVHTADLDGNDTCVQGLAPGQITFEVLSLPSAPIVLYIQQLEQPKVICPPINSTQKPLRRILKKEDINQEKYCAVASNITTTQHGKSVDSKSTNDVAKQKDYTQSRKQKEFFKCSKCYKKFIELENLEQHLLIHCTNMEECIKQDSDYHCDKCGKNYACRYALRRHEQLHDGFQNSTQTEKKGNEHDFHCEKCGKRFVRRYALTRHERLHSGDFRHLCSICGKGFVDAIYLRQHVEGHTRQHSCDICGKSFSRSKDLTVHLRQHTGEAPYKCTLCDSSFKSNNGLQYHKATHNDIKTHVCTICGRKFPHVGNLRSHMNSHNEENKVLSCTECGNFFPNRYRLKIHNMSAHPGVGNKPLTCRICEKQFVMLGNLKSHLCSHMTDAPYACNLCSKKYRKVQDLNAHKSKIHKDSLRECDPFDAAGNIFRHLMEMPVLQ